jgi:hypothetical protein
MSRRLSHAEPEPSPRRSRPRWLGTSASLAKSARQIPRSPRKRRSVNALFLGPAPRIPAPPKQLLWRQPVPPRDCADRRADLVALGNICAFCSAVQLRADRHQ